MSKSFLIESEKARKSCQLQNHLETQVTPCSNLLALGNIFVAYHLKKAWDKKCSHFPLARGITSMLQKSATRTAMVMAVYFMSFTLALVLRYEYRHQQKSILIFWHFGGSKLQNYKKVQKDIITMHVLPWLCNQIYHKMMGFTNMDEMKFPSFLATYV